MLNDMRYAFADAPPRCTQTLRRRTFPPDLSLLKNDGPGQQDHQEEMDDRLPFRKDNLK